MERGRIGFLVCQLVVFTGLNHNLGIKEKRMKPTLTELADRVLELFESLPYPASKDGLAEKEYHQAARSLCMAVKESEEQKARGEGQFVPRPIF